MTSPAHTGLEDVRRWLRDLFVRAGKPSYVGLLVADKDELHRIADPDVEHSVEREVLTLPVSAEFPSTRRHAGTAGGFRAGP
ncbi:hypothetical protein [Streptomyces virginiae]|uniref:Uncharacterized protein n=1 Tax=Streptomyces virginiae TaxID=1961 RepID=A0ABZ1TPF7_STRVG|nr:hypothetical protein [Streptomyces virginiae]